MDPTDHKSVNCPGVQHSPARLSISAIPFSDAPHPLTSICDLSIRLQVSYCHHTSTQINSVWNQQCKKSTCRIKLVSLTRWGHDEKWNMELHGTTVTSLQLHVTADSVKVIIHQRVQDSENDKIQGVFRIKLMCQEVFMIGMTRQGGSLLENMPRIWIKAWISKLYCSSEIRDCCTGLCI